MSLHILVSRWAYFRPVSDAFFVPRGGTLYSIPWNTMFHPMEQIKSFLAQIRAISDPILPFCHHFATRNTLIINECCKMTSVASLLKTSCSRRSMPDDFVTEAMNAQLPTQSLDTDYPNDDKDYPQKVGYRVQSPSAGDNAGIPFVTFQPLDTQD